MGIYCKTEVGLIDGVKVYSNTIDDFGGSINVFEEDTGYIDFEEIIDNSFHSGSEYNETFTKLKHAKKLIKNNFYRLNCLKETLKKECDIVYTLGFAKGYLVDLTVQQYMSYGHSIDCKPIVIDTTDKVYTEFNLTKYFDEVLKLQNFDKVIGNFKEEFIIENFQISKEENEKIDKNFYESNNMNVLDYSNCNPF